MNLPKMYCLSCTQIPWRNQSATEVFRAAGLEVEWYYGVHGATAGIMPELTVWDVPRDHSYRNNSGKLSITISKMLLWQRILDLPDDPVLVFENDVVFCDDFRSELAQSMAALPEDWDVVHVGHCCTDGKPYRKINDRVREIKHPLCCHAILWRKRAIAVAMEEFRRASWGTNSDIILERAVYPKLRHYSFFPGLCYQNDTPSEAGSTGRWDTIQGWFDFEKLYDEALDRVALSRKPATFVEVGCWKGRSTAFMAEEIKRRLLPVTFYGVDTWKGMPFASLDQVVINEFGGDLFPTFLRNMSRAGVIDYVQPLQMTSVEAAERFPDASCDFVFIDADHTYESVKADLLAWVPKMKHRGVIAGHDYGMDGVRQAVEEVLPGQFRVWESCWIADKLKGRH